MYHSGCCTAGPMAFLAKRNKRITYLLLLEAGCMCGCTLPTSSCWWGARPDHLPGCASVVPQHAHASVVALQR